jgi:hypothetical protein
VRSRCPLGRGPDAATWPIARDVSQRAEPDVRPLGHTISAFIAKMTCHLSAPLTGDVPSRHLMYPATPLADNDQTALLAVCLSNQTAGSTSVPPRARRGHYDLYDAMVASVVRQCYASSKYQGTWRLHKVTDISCSGYSIRYVPGPTCRGSVSLYVPPLSYKREGTRCYMDDSQLSSFHSNPTQSGVGYYAPVARTTLNPCVFMCLTIA